jgi:hypothetical protein
VLEALREGLRCRELWVVGANKYRNPDDDLPKDFEEKRKEYYEALGQPNEAKAFVDALQQQMIAALESFDRALPKLAPKVRILEKNGGWIHLSPLAWTSRELTHTRGGNQPALGRQSRHLKGRPAYRLHPALQSPATRNLDRSLTETLPALSLRSGD